ncbi:MAG: polysaccharide biosynthesis protein [Phycisphaerae bacterium]
MDKNRTLVGIELYVLRHRLPVSIAIHAILFALSLLLAYTVRFEISNQAVEDVRLQAEQAVPAAVRNYLDLDSQTPLGHGIERSFGRQADEASGMIQQIQQQIARLGLRSNWLEESFLPWLPIFLAIKLLVFGRMKLYRGAWHYSSIRDVGNIVVASWIFLALMIGLTWGTRFLIGNVPSLDAPKLAFVAQQPTGVLLLDFLGTVFLICTARLGFRLYHEEFRLRPQSSEGVARVLIIGASNAAEVVIREISRMAVEKYRVIGVVDDDPAKKGVVIYGVPVMGKTEDIPKLCEKHKIDELLIAMPGAPHKELRRVIEVCEGTTLRYRHMPGVTELIDGKVTVSQIRPVDINDLLGREAVKLDPDALDRFLKSRTILITGAGGSIGSEMSRQVSKYSPSKLILLEQAETPLFDIENELRKSHPELRILPVICDIYDRQRVMAVWEKHRPEVVIHAAAHKHVPLMEHNPCEAVKNNILGTRNVADASCRFDVHEFVMISTDKAVNPSSVMGTSKRVAEIYTQSLNGSEGCKTQFKAVRFGNVLGSNGSVVPTFRRQIDSGGPVTVTHPEMTRYFMTIPEAAQLVLQAAATGVGGQIFLLDMGEPVKILDLARTMITLSGLRPGEDIDIVFSGCRPGEKLFEELRTECEDVEQTVHPKIMVWKHSETHQIDINQKMSLFESLANNLDRDSIIEALKSTVPEYTPLNPPESAGSKSGRQPENDDQQTVDISTPSS